MTSIRNLMVMVMVIIHVGFSHIFELVHKNLVFLITLAVLF